MLKRLVAIFVLWLPFTGLALLAIPKALYETLRYSKDIRTLYAMDKLGAAVLGWSGLYTISAEVHFPRTRWQEWTKDFLNWLDPGHTERAARGEDLP
jgi:hypothetical protein